MLEKMNIYTKHFLSNTSTLSSQIQRNYNDVDAVTPSQKFFALLVRLK